MTSHNTRTSGRLRRWAVAAALSAAIALAAAGSASAVGQIEYGGCISNTTSGGECGPSSAAMDQPQAVAVSPDGHSVYVASDGQGAVAVYGRAPHGQLTYAGCVSNTGSGGQCANIPGDPLVDVNAIVVSPDGRNVYATAYSTGVVAAFKRAAEGQLTYAGCVSSDGTGDQCTALNKPFSHHTSLAISPDGHQLYTDLEDGVAVLDRDATGQLSWAGCVTDGGAGGACAKAPAPSMGNANAVVVSPDGRSVYLTSNTSYSVTAFDRAPKGQITWAGCVSSSGTDGHCADAPGTALVLPRTLALSPDGRTMYVASTGAAAVAVLDRAPTGQITYAGCVSDDGSGNFCADVPGTGTPLQHPSALAVSPDGETVYAASSDGTVTALDRAKGGQITYAGCVSNDGSGSLCADPPGTPLTGADSLAVSPDSGSLYATAHDVGTVAHFFRKVRPDTAIVGGPAPGSASRDRTPTFAFASDQEGPGYQCSLDGRAFAGCPALATFGPLADGRHTLAVRAVTGGDADRTPAARSFRVDTTGPRVLIAKGPKAKVRLRRGAKARVRFVFAATERGARVRCSLDGGAFKACSSPARVRVGRGRHRFVVRAVDSLGNAGPAAERRFRVTRRRR